ncbi:MAG: cytochrome c [Methylobacter sp.]|nr:cytochrome c [Methylobacter sp.]
MKKQYFSKKIFAITAASVFSVGICTPALAENATGARPLELRKIMQELDKNMQIITASIAREDWALVTKIAPRIAEHPQPPLDEKMRILAFIGADAGKFESHDETTHQAARALEQVAERNDGQGVIAAFANLQNSCLACHQSFRKPFVEHFYGQR